MEDAEIVALFTRRSQQAVAALDAKYRRLCAGVARNILRSARDVEECVNDAYLAVWNTVPPQRPDPLAVYVCRIVRNLALKRRRADTAQKRGGTYDAALDELAGSLAGPDTAESATRARELAAGIDRWLDGQDPRSRTLFVRRYWYGDGLETVAHALGMTRHGAAVRLSRLRERLRRYLESEGFLP